MKKRSQSYTENLETKNNKTKGQFETYKISDVSTDSSFLEMLDILNENLINEGKDPIAFDHDCREGICGMCSLYINGRAHILIQVLLLVSCICVTSKMVRLFISSHGEVQPFQ